MRRGKVELKKIENKSNRMVTFSKRRNGLMKKAGELSVLCGVEIGIVVFSEKGKLYEFATGNSLNKVLEHYQTRKNAEEAVCSRVPGAKKHLIEYANSCTSSELMQTLQRYHDEEKAEQMNMTQLTQLEQQLDSLLAKTQYRKEQLMMETMTPLQEKVAAAAQEETAYPRLPDLNPTAGGNNFYMLPPNLQ